MDKLQATMEKFFVPFAAKINGQRHVAAVRDAFYIIIPTDNGRFNGFID